VQYADVYFQKQPLYKRLIDEEPAADLGLIIIIPAYNENNLTEALEGLCCCEMPAYSAEVLVLINYPDNCCVEIEKFHQKQYELLMQWEKFKNCKGLNFHFIIKQLPLKDAGVGLARKILMDEACFRFNLNNNAKGIIASFDADCKVDGNYLISIEQLFKKNQKLNGCSIYFEHLIEGDAYSKFQYLAITKYELHLRYYIEALRYAGFPYSFHTIGSCFAVKADAYVKQGGMNKRKAGEDYYFLQKIIALGNFTELNTTRVIPSLRLSNRVPFGTGAALNKMMLANNIEYFTFNPQAFVQIKLLFSKIEKLYKANKNEIVIYTSDLHIALQNFLYKNKALEKINEINGNSNSLASFKKRFFNWFNGLMILQFLNDSHNSEFNKIRIEEACLSLLMKNEMQFNNNNAVQLLKFFRDIQRNKEMSN
jgi:hypothetical protein